MRFLTKVFDQLLTISAWQRCLLVLLLLIPLWLLVFWAVAEA